MVATQNPTRIRHPPAATGYRSRAPKKAHSLVARSCATIDSNLRPAGWRVTSENLNPAEQIRRRRPLMGRDRQDTCGKPNCWILRSTSGCQP